MPASPASHNDNPSNGGPDGWNAYARLVLAELERLSDGQEKMRLTIENDRIEKAAAIAALNAKAGLWGGICGAIPAGIAVVVSLIKH